MTTGNPGLHDPAGTAPAGTAPQVAGAGSGAPDQTIARPVYGASAGVTPVERRRRSSALWGVGAAVAGFGVVVAAAVALKALAPDVEESEAGPPSSAAAASGPPDTAVAQATTAAGDTMSTAAQGPPSRLVPTGATATSTLKSQTSRCTGGTFTYGAANAIDGSEQTAWAPAPDDGSGEKLTVAFGASVHLRQVGLTPGYTKVGPTAWSSCQPVPLFAHNRNIRAVRYHFDSAEPVDQTLTDDATLQTIPVDVVTTKVTIEIVATELPGGSNVDDDTLISETAFYGVNAGGSGPGPGADSAATTLARPDPGPPRCLDNATATALLRRSAARAMTGDEAVDVKRCLDGWAEGVIMAGPDPVGSVAFRGEGSAWRYATSAAVLRVYCDNLAAMGPPPQLLSDCSG